MEYSKIVAITGLPGLYEMINSKTDGAIVRSLDDKTSKFIASRIHKMTQLETIEVFTVEDNVNLIEVFQAMDAAQAELPGDKDNDALTEYFKKAFPKLDFDKVYGSDMKKMVKWFSILKGNGIALKLSEPAEKPVEPVVQPEPEPVSKATAEPETTPATPEEKPPVAKAKKADSPSKKAEAPKKKAEPDKTKKTAAKSKTKK